MKPTHFRKNLLKWHAANDRPLPWKGEKNPYYIWLSEIILQQTRVEQGLPYFESDENVGRFGLLFSRPKFTRDSKKYRL